MAAPVYWANGLCSCFGDCSTCIVTWLFPCYTAGRNAEAVGESCFLHCLAYHIPFVKEGTLASVRGKIRRLKGIAGSFTDDLLNVIFCEFCSLVQEARELKEPGSESIARE